jgi:hypothetical protein
MLTDVLEVITALVMEAASTSETLVYFYQTTLRNAPEDSHVRIFIFVQYSEPH